MMIQNQREVKISFIDNCVLKSDINHLFIIVIHSFCKIFCLDGTV